MPVTELLGMLAVVFAFAAVAGGMIFAFYRIRVSTHQTIQTLVEKGTDTSGELVHMLSNLGRTKPNYLRRGLLLIAVGLATAVSIGVMAVEDARVLVALSAFPFFVGGAYLILWWVTPESE